MDTAPEDWEHVKNFGIPQLRPFPIGDNYIRNPGNLESLAETTMLRQG
ncbi:MAG: hypothetical protein WA261_13845 [Candidatus Sulfotelmatobacter sp.]|jgi:hypothetical protein